MDTNEVIQSGLLSIEGESPTMPETKIKFPEFPLWWLDKAKRNMEGLREIASHLHGKTETLRMSRGFRGDATEMGRQIIYEISEVKQATLHMTDALESRGQSPKVFVLLGCAKHATKECPKSICNTFSLQLP